jgi:hypothetical protein
MLSAVMVSGIDALVAVIERLCAEVAALQRQVAQLTT